MPPLYAAPLLSGDMGTTQTIDKIRELVDGAWRDAEVRRFAFEIVHNAGAQPYDKTAQALAIYNWVSASTYFLNDPVNKEMLMPVRELLRMYRETGAIPGDCDDINATLLPALLGAIGIDTRLVTVASDGRDPSIFSHIYAEAKLGGEWIPLDAARPGAQWGLAPDIYYRRAWWALDSDAHGDYEESPEMQPALAGLGDYMDPRCQSVVQPAIGPGGTLMVPQQQSGLNVKALGWLAVGVGVLLLLTGRLK